MTKTKSQKIKLLSSAALLSLAVYGTAVSPAFARENFHNDRNPVKISTGVRSARESNIVITKGIVKSISDKTLVVTRPKDGQDFNVTVSDKTKIFRRYEKGSFDEIKVGHIINVIGKISVDDPADITATMLRDLSLTMRHSVISGIVDSTDDGKIILSSKKVKGISVDTTGAKLTDRKNREINVTDIHAGDRVKVRGLWDSENQTLTEVMSIRDFSLPDKK